MEQTFDSLKARKAQKDYTDSNSLPHFAPTSGICWSCKQDIYKQIDRGTYKTGISVESAGVGLITGCPHCNRSYCD